MLKCFVVSAAKPLPFQVTDASRSEQEILEAEAKAKDKDVRVLIDRLSFDRVFVGLLYRAARSRFAVGLLVFDTVRAGDP